VKQRPKQNRDLEVKIVDGKVESFGELGECFEETESEKEDNQNVAVCLKHK
jgi:hypothetical protein